METKNVLDRHTQTSVGQSEHHLRNHHRDSRCAHRVREIPMLLCRSVRDPRPAVCCQHMSLISSCARFVLFADPPAASPRSRLWTQVETHLLSPCTYFWLLSSRPRCCYVVGNSVKFLTCPPRIPSVANRGPEGSESSRNSNLASIASNCRPSVREAAPTHKRIAIF